MAKNVGTVVHYYDKLGVAIIDLAAPLKVGDTVTFTRGEESFEKTISSLQINHKDVQSAKAGVSVGVKVDSNVKEGTIVATAD